MSPCRIASAENRDAARYNRWRAHGFGEAFNAAQTAPRQSRQVGAPLVGKFRFAPR